MLLFEKIVQNKTEINLALDKDVYSKTMFISSMLSEYDVKVNIVDTRSAEDVGDMTISEFEEHLKNAKTFYKEDKLLRKISLL
jgi:3-phosphoglycerate kinase